MVGAIDGAFVGLPVDAVVASYVYQDRGRFVLYALMASVGSALGSIVFTSLVTRVVRNSYASAFRLRALKGFMRRLTNIRSGA